MGEASLWGSALGATCDGSEAVWGWLVYPAIMLYSFYILACICDGHLTTALEFIVQRIKMSEDVAGATFLAMASSAPELFTSIVSTCVLQSASGVGNILGSAVFNLLVIIGVVPIFAGRGLKIWWYPTFRDATFYTVAILEVFLVLLDGEVQWWEGAIMTCSYIIYVVYFIYNESIIKYFDLTPPRVRNEEETPPEVQNEVDVEQQQQPRHDVSLPGGVSDTGGTDSEIVSTISNLSNSDRTPEEEDQVVALSSLRSANGSDEVVSRPNALRRSDSKNSFTLKGKDRYKNGRVVPGNDDLTVPEEPAITENEQDFRGVVPQPEDAAPEGEDAAAAGDEEPSRGWCRYEPTMIIIDATMPVRPESVYTLFGLCCTWIGIFTYLAVDASTRLGCLLDLDDEVMGLIILAAGTSVPDAMGSIAVARDGFGDMAVANAVGSNTFDILLGLGLPWFIYALVTQEPIVLPNRHVNFAIAILSICLVGYLAAISINRWRLTERLGYLMLLAYVLVIVLILMRYYGRM